MLERLRTCGFASQPEKEKVASRKKGATKDVRGLKISEEDLLAVKAKAREIIADLAPRYYLDSGVEPEVRVQGDAIRITIPAEKLR